MKIPLFTADLSLGKDPRKSAKTTWYKLRSMSNGTLQEELVIPTQGICARNLGACYAYCATAWWNDLDCFGGCAADFSICRASGGRYHFVPKFQSP